MSKHEYIIDATNNQLVESLTSTRAVDPDDALEPPSTEPFTPNP